MSFWKSQKINKSRKIHRCIYCGKIIDIGNSYYRETGTYENDFNDYCLCERCSWVIDNLDDRRNGDELGDLDNTLIGGDFLSCEVCGGYNHRELKYSPDMMIAKCVCDKCGNEYEVDLSIEGLKEITKRW